MSLLPRFPRKIYYGWWLVLACLIIMAFGSGTTIYLYSLVAGVVTADFGAMRAESMLGLMIMVLIVAFISPKIGSLVDTQPIRRVLYVGAVLLGAGFLLASVSTAIWQVAVIYALFMSCGLALLGQITAAALMCRWFSRSRGVALGIVALGTQAGGFFFPPVVASLMTAFGWRVALASVGVFVLVGAPLIIRFMIYDHPRDKGLEPEAPASDEVEGAEAARLGRQADEEITSAKLLRSPILWLVVLFVSASAGTNFALIGNLATFATDLGESLERGAGLISVFAVAGIFSSPLFGRITDRADSRLAAAAALMMTAASLMLFILADSYAMLVAAALLLGLGGGATFPLWAAMIGAFFPTRTVGRALGLSTLFANPAMAFFAVFSGWSYDVTQSYRTVLSVMMGLCLVAATMALCSRFNVYPFRAPPLGRPAE